MNELKKIGIMGGGASGMMAAIVAARAGADVTIFERNPMLGKKLLVTGNGRCNISNRNVSYRDFFGANPKFTASVFGRFSNTDTEQFFKEIGAPFIEADQGRLFPKLSEGTTIVDLLSAELKRQGVHLELGKTVRDITRDGDGFVVVTFDGKKFPVDSVIVASGGKTYPSLGATGNGYSMANKFGHTVTALYPTSTAFKIKSKVCHALQGIKINTKIKITQKDEILTQNEGEMLFTHFGLSAPVILESSRYVSDKVMQEDNEGIFVTVNIFPELSPDQLFDKTWTQLQEFPDRIIGNQFNDMVPKKVVPTIMKDVGLDPQQLSSKISKKQLLKLLSVLTKLKFKINDVFGWERAQFTSGGVDVKELDSRTMESKIVPGLYFTGEVVDIDGRSGGFNLQWAWSSGWLAGVSASQSA